LVRRTIGNYADIFATSQKRDKFRTRLEWGTEPGTMEIYVSHQGTEQVPREGAEKGSTNSETPLIVWTPVRANAEVEAEMLARLAVAFGSAPPQADPGAERTTTASSSASSSTAPRARLERDNSGSGTLVVDDLFDRAWRRVGLALDRGGFTVVDRDRSKGLYFVRYADPDLVSSKKDDGWLSKLAFWKNDDKPKPEQYRIVVNDGGQTSTVLVQDPNGAPDRSPNGQKILALLRDELK
jgi:outer membrane protein assembly factor BamC